MLKAYESVLPKHGLDLEADTHYYRLVLQRCLADRQAEGESLAAGSHSEMQSSPSRHGSFDCIDINGDGVIDRAEWAKAGLSHT